ncbi:DNA polymerase IV [uncultured Methanoregula sp.]|uniref:DNA polymerase IV n=1 Tax=uncultured Methanoregula sp. TaxID=1005933 RepID=UPI002AAAF072|nr:DNA polymerase IV [uncultured Methanoregula sp.]
MIPDADFPAGPGPVTSPGSGEISRQRIILHLDMDSFYASVEMQKRPDIRKKPVIIGADPKGGVGRGVVCTCSYEARAFGVHSAQPISRAYTLCPGAVYLRPDFALYSSVSESVMAILRTCGFPLQQVSIDEAFLDVSSSGDYLRARNIALQVKREIVSRLGITCSIGIGPGKTIAKIASDFHKPDGLTIVTPEDLQAFLAPLPVRKVPGIGKKSEEELSRLGILTIGDLTSAGPGMLVSRFGRGAVSLLNSVRGIDESEVCESTGARSISRETTFEQDTDNLHVIGDTLGQLAGAVSRTLAGEHFLCRTVTVKVRFENFDTRTRCRTLSHPTDDPAMVRTCALTLFRDLYTGGKIRLIGIRLSSINRPDACQLTLSGINTVPENG